MGGDEVPSPEARSGRGRRWVAVGLALGAFGLAAWAARWMLQGGDVVWTDLARSFWVPDRTLGWVETERRWVWLGLEGGVALGVVVLGTGLAWLVARRLARGADGARTTSGLFARLSLVGAGVAMLGPVLPGWAFLSGTPPDGAERLLPSDVTAVASDAARRATLAADPFAVPGGRWVLADAPVNVLVAKIDAGDETFEARFGPLVAELRLDPVALERTSASLRVPAASIETGVALRDRHARGYLEVDRYPTIALELPRLDEVRCADAACSFSTAAELRLMGRSIPVALEGSATVIDAAARTSLGIAEPHALLVSARFDLPLASTPLRRENFDSDTISMTGRFVLVPATPMPDAL